MKLHVSAGGAVVVFAACTGNIPVTPSPNDIVSARSTVDWAARQGGVLRVVVGQDSAVGEPHLLGGARVRIGRRLLSIDSVEAIDLQVSESPGGPGATTVMAGVAVGGVVSLALSYMRSSSTSTRCSSACAVAWFVPGAFLGAVVALEEHDRAVPRHWQRVWSRAP